MAAQLICHHLDHFCVSREEWKIMMKLCRSCKISQIMEAELQLDMCLVLTCRLTVWG